MRDDHHAERYRAITAELAAPPPPPRPAPPPVAVALPPPATPTWLLILRVLRPVLWVVLLLLAVFVLYHLTH